MAKKKKASSKVIAKKAAPRIVITREIPNDQTAILANNLAVQTDGPEFHLLFFQTHPPMIDQDPTDDTTLAKMIEKQGGVRSLCVARIVVSASRMEGFIQALQEHYQKHQSVLRNRLGESE